MANCSRDISQGEKCHGDIVLFRDVQSDIQRHGRLAHAGAGCDQHQVGLIEPVDLLVQVPQAAGQAGERVAGLGKLRQPVEDFQEDRPDMLQGLACVAVAQGINLLLCVFQDTRPPGRCPPATDSWISAAA